MYHRRWISLLGRGRYIRTPALKSLRFLPVLLMVAVCLAPSPVAADRGLTVEGAILSRTVSPGQTITHRMTVKLGAEARATQITVRVAHMGQSLTGSYQLLDTAGNAAPSALPFIRLDKESFHLEPGGSEVVVATIRVPADVGDGSRYALINIRTEPSGEGALGTISAVNVPVALRVENTPLYQQGEITELGLEPTGEQSLNIDTIFYNTGNHHVSIKADIIIRGVRGAIVETISMPHAPGSVIPYNARRMQARYEPVEELAQGVYIVKCRVMLKDGTVLDEKREALEVTDAGVVILDEVPEEPKINWSLLLAITGGAAAVGLIMFLIRRRLQHMLRR